METTPKKDKALYQISLKLLLKNAEGKILTLKALDNRDLFAGFYDLPGGRIHEDEDDRSFTEILQREVREEIGDVRFSVEPESVSTSRWTYHFQDGRLVRIFYLFFEGTYEGGEIHISYEHQYQEWVNLMEDDLGKRFPPALLPGIQEYVKNEKLKM